MTPTPPLMTTWTRAVVGTACALTVILALATVAAPSQREIALATQADTLARNSSGALFVHADGATWYQPLAVYPSAWLMRAGVRRHLALQLPGAIAGALTIVLTHLLTRRVTGGRKTGALAAALLLVAPGFHAHSRAAGAPLLIAVATLCWLICVLEHAVRPRAWLPVGGGLALGLSIYTQPAGVLTVPIYFAVGCAMVCRGARGRSATWLGAVGVGFALIPAALWLWHSPPAYADTFGRWGMHAAHIRNPWEGAVAFLRWHVMARRVGAYWEYLNPTFLFGREMLGLALAGLVPLGVWASTAARSMARALCLVALLAAPVAGVLLDEPRDATFAVLYLPFGALFAAWGLAALAGRRLRATVAAGGGGVSH